MRVILFILLIIVCFWDTKADWHDEDAGSFMDHSDKSIINNNIEKIENSHQIDKQALRDDHHSYHTEGDSLRIGREADSHNVYSKAREDQSENVRTIRVDGHDIHIGVGNGDDIDDHHNHHESLCTNGKKMVDKLARAFRREEAIRLCDQSLSRIINALDKIMLLPNSSDPQFCPLIEFVLDNQVNRLKMNIQIDTIFLCNQCDFIRIWGNLANLYHSGKRIVTSYTLVSYSDVNCKRTVSLQAVGLHIGRVNWLPGDPNQDPYFPGPPWHTSYNFYDSDRFTITWVETSPGLFQIRELIQFTEQSWDLGNSTRSGLIPGRVPGLPGSPGDLILPLRPPGCINHACPPPGGLPVTPCPLYHD